MFISMLSLHITIILASLISTLFIQETADMLKTHIKEELMQGDEEDNALYVPMVNLSADILMKCSLHPGSDEDLYETMVGLQYDTDDTCEYFVIGNIIRSSCSILETSNMFALAVIQ